MKITIFAMLMWATVATTASAILASVHWDESGAEAGDRASQVVADRDKRGTRGEAANNNGPQTPMYKALASRGSFQAEGKGFEPSTPCGAPTFQAGC